MIKLALLLAALASGATPAPASDEVLVSVNGTPLRRSEVMDRTWRLHGTAVLNAMADELLVRQAAEKLKLKADASEINARIKRVRDQFPDEQSYITSLDRSGTTPSDLRSRIETQVLREGVVVKAKDLSISEAEVKEYYDANKEKLAAPEAVRLRHIILASEKEANDFMVAIKAGADFAKLASQVSLDRATKDKGGDLGFISKGIMLAELERLVFSLKPGEVGGPVKSLQGYSLFKVEEARAPKPAVFEEIKTPLKQAMLAERIEKAWPGYIQGLRDAAQLIPGGKTAPAAPPR